MKAVILAGGFGTRLGEETQLLPKPMLEIGGRPILWHIMKMYSHYGINDFVILLGYRGYMIKDYFLNYLHHESDITVDLKKNTTEIHRKSSEPWRVTLVETGLNTMTGGRLLRAKEYLKNETFCFTYGDGVSNVDIKKLIAYHRKHGKTATITAVQLQGRYGAVEMDHKSGRIRNFQEKPEKDENWINGGFMVLEPSVFKYIKGDETSFEYEPADKLTKNGELFAYRHPGFWQCMDTPRDKTLLNDIWAKGNAPWQSWK